MKLDASHLSVFFVFEGATEKDMGIITANLTDLIDRANNEGLITAGTSEECCLHKPPYVSVGSLDQILTQAGYEIQHLPTLGKYRWYNEPNGYYSDQHFNTESEASASALQDYLEP